MKRLKCHIAAILFCLLLQSAMVFAEQSTCQECDMAYPVDYVYCPFCGKMLGKVPQDKPFIISDNSIVHLGHSAVLVNIDGHILIFDYPYRPISTDWIYPLQPEELPKERVYVFSSHRHGDHHDNRIYTWKDKIPKLKFILASDITSHPDDAVVVEPNQIVEVDDLKIRTYPSTDSGVAYSVYVNNKHIYFAGDNGFWNWKGERSQQDYVKNDLARIDRVTPIDIAFQVCDPLAVGVGDGGIGIFALTFQPKLLVPIHLRGQYEYLQYIERQLQQRGFKNRFWVVKRHPDMLSLPSLDLPE